MIQSTIQNTIHTMQSKHCNTKNTIQNTIHAIQPIALHSRTVVYNTTVQNKPN